MGTREADRSAVKREAERETRGRLVRGAVKQNRR